MMKKIVFITVAFAIQAPLINATSRRTTKVCPCVKPKPQQPVQQQQQVQQAQTQSENNELGEVVSRKAMVKECCQMIKNEAQKLSNHELACEILEVLLLTERQENEEHRMTKYPCKQEEKPQQQEAVQQHPPVPSHKNAEEFAENTGEQQPVVKPQIEESSEQAEQTDSDTALEIPAKDLLADCCLALADEAREQRDHAALTRAEKLMEKVDMIPSMKQ